MEAYALQYEAHVYRLFVKTKQNILKEINSMNRFGESSAFFTSKDTLILSSVNPITTRGADYASPPGFENPAASLLCMHLFHTLIDIVIISLNQIY